MTTDQRVDFYEGMFLFGQAASSDLPAVVAHLKGILDRGPARIVTMKKWDERRLAYEIDKQKRGLFILVYFHCPRSGLAAIERASNLSEVVVRHLMTRADHLTEDEAKVTSAQEELNVDELCRVAAERASADTQTAGVQG